MNTGEPTGTRGHEDSDIRVSAFKRVLIAFVVVAVAIHLGVWWLYQYFRTEDQRRDARRTRVEASPPVPPEPRLQVNPQADFQEYLRKQQEILGSYGWVSRAEGKVRIPIDRAMGIVVEREKR
jgi:hypothetical protein